MPRYDDRDRYASNTRLYVGHLSSRTRSHDLDDIFSRYGRIRDVDLKHDFAFIEFSDPRDADDARHHLNGRPIDGSRIVVEFAKGVPRGSGGSREYPGPRGSASSREYLGRGPPPGSGRCFNCGLDGHWARDCKAGDWKNKCYRCGERGHIERKCPNSPKSLKRGKSYSRSPTPRRVRSRSRSFSRSRSYSPSTTRRERSVEDEVRRSRSPSNSRSPQPKGEDPQERESPIGKSRSPSPVGRGDQSPSEANGHSPSPSRDDARSPVEDADGDSPSSAQD